MLRNPKHPSYTGSNPSIEGSNRGFLGQNPRHHKEKLMKASVWGSLAVDNIANSFIKTRIKKNRRINARMFLPFILILNFAMLSTAKELFIHCKLPFWSLWLTFATKRLLGPWSPACCCNCRNLQDIPGRNVEPSPETLGLWGELGGSHLVGIKVLAT